MAYIKQKSERKYKITVCNGYKGQRAETYESTNDNSTAGSSQAWNSAVCYG